MCLCCDLLTSVCRAALQFCDGALDCHLQVIVGTLTAQVTSRPPPISQQVRPLEWCVYSRGCSADVVTEQKRGPGGTSPAQPSKHGVDDVPRELW